MYSNLLAVDTNLFQVYFDNFIGFTSTSFM